MPQIDIKPMTDRVVISHEGHAVRPDVAFYRYGVCSKVIFIRGDGWAIGAPEEFEYAAFHLWENELKEFRRWPKYELQPISEYKPSKRRQR